MVELFEAAAEYHHARPWKRLRDAAFLEVELPDGPVWAASVMGAGGITRGLALYSDPRDLEILFDSEAPAHFADIAWRCLGLTFETPDGVPPRMRKEIARKGWPLDEPDAIPTLLAMNTPGGGLSRRDARALTLVLRAVASGAPHLAKPFRLGRAAEWRDPVTGVRLRLWGDTPAMEPVEAEQHDLFADPPRASGSRRRTAGAEPTDDERWNGARDDDIDDGLDDGWDDNRDAEDDDGWDDAWDEEEDEEELVWVVPETVSPGRAEGPAARPEAALEALEPGAREGEEARHLELLGRFRRWLLKGGVRSGGSPKGVLRAAERFLEFLRGPRGVPLEALHEYHLRLFLYRALPSDVGPIFEADVAIEDYVGMARGLEALFAFLDEEGIRCPWAEEILGDVVALVRRWEDYPGEVPDPLAAGPYPAGPPEGPEGGEPGDGEDAERWDAEEALRELTGRTLAAIDWEDELDIDLGLRVMTPRDRTADGRSWMEALTPERWDLDAELQARWLLWREEAIAQGLRDPEAVRERAAERQEVWEQTPHPHLGGLTPLEALTAEEEAFARRLSGPAEEA